MNIIEIEMNSEAGRELAALVRDSGVYRIRIAPDHGGPGTVAIKANESMWSAPLRATIGPRTELEDLLSPDVEPCCPGKGDEHLATCPLYGVSS